MRKITDELIALEACMNMKLNQNFITDDLLRRSMCLETFDKKNNSEHFFY